MKRISALIIGILLVCISFTVFAADDNYKYNELESLGIIPQGFANSDMNDALTREELAWIATSLLPDGQKEAVDTRFVDVKSDNIYSGSIAFLDSMDIIHGVDETRFDPKGRVSTDMFYKVLFEIIGYGDFANLGGGYPDGYLSLARSFRSMRTYTASGMILSKADAVELVHNVIFTEFGGLSYYYENGELKSQTDSKDRFSILGKHLGISVYRGIADDIDEERLSLTLTSISNETDTNAVVIKEGSTKSFKLTCDSPYRYEKAPVVVFADINDNIVHIDIAENAEIKFGYIYSVNNNANKNSHYSISGVNTLTLLDDEEEYKVSDDALMRYNNEMSYAPAKMVGNFARIILTDGKVSFIELWNLAEGGLISEAEPNYVSYIGGTAKRKIKDLDKYNYKYVFVDNEPASGDALKAKMVFDWYAKGDYIVFVASSKNIIDEFLSVSNEFAEIGNSLYIADTVYYSDNGLDYKANDYETAIGSTVTAYIGPDGYVRYVEVSGEKTSLKKFFGAVCGGKHDNFSSNGELEILHLDAGMEKKKYTVDKNTAFEDGLTLDELSANCANTDLSDDVYVFEITSSGAIRRVSKPLPYYGYIEGGRTRKKVTSFVEANPGFVTFGNKRLYFTNNALVLGLYEKNGEVMATPLTWSKNLSGRSNLELTMDFYGEEELHDEPSLIVITGTIDRLGERYAKYGIVSDNRSLGLLDDGSVGSRVNIFNSAGKTPYSVTNDYADTLKEYSLIRYIPGLKYGDNEIYVTEEIADFSKHYTEWITAEQKEPTSGLVRGTVKKIEDMMLWLEDGSVYPISTGSYKLIAEVNEGDSKERFKIITQEDIFPGDEVFFYLSSSDIYVLIRIQ